MMGHKICFNEEMRLIIIPKLSLLPFLSGALILDIACTKRLITNPNPIMLL